MIINVKSVKMFLQNQGLRENGLLKEQAQQVLLQIRLQIQATMELILLKYWVIVYKIIIY